MVLQELVCKINVFVFSLNSATVSKNRLLDSKLLL